MNTRIIFKAGELASQIARCEQQLMETYASYGLQVQLESLKSVLQSISSEEKIRVAFIGQYSAGKSSIVSALTGNGTIKIDSDISTTETTDYPWGDSVLLTDTPGLYTENTSHDEKTIDVIKKSDLLVYCITSDLFTQYTLKDFINWAFVKGYKGKMFLVINKMSKEAGDYQTLVVNYTTTLNRSLSPHNIDEFPHCFVDAKDYRDGFSENDEDLIGYSHFEKFISQLNTFINESGQLGKLDTPIKALKSSIADVQETLAVSEESKAYIALLNRISVRVERKRQQLNRSVHAILNTGLNPIKEKGYELSQKVGFENIVFSEEDMQKLISSCCDNVNQELSMVTEQCWKELSEEVSQVISSETAEFFFHYIDKTVGTRTLFWESSESQNSREQFKTLSNIIQNISGTTLEFALKEGSSVSNLFLKASQSSGSGLHQAIKVVGTNIGYKFKPWQAVNLAKSIGNIANIVGPALSIIGGILDIKAAIDEKKQAEELRIQQIEFRNEFIKIFDELKHEYISEIDDSFEIYREIILKLNVAKKQIHQKQESQKDLMQQLTTLNEELTSIQNAIFQNNIS